MILSAAVSSWYFEVQSDPGEWNRERGSLCPAARIYCHNVCVCFSKLGLMPACGGVAGNLLLTMSCGACDSLFGNDITDDAIARLTTASHGTVAFFEL